MNDSIIATIINYIKRKAIVWPSDINTYKWKTYSADSYKESTEEMDQYTFEINGK